ncbi:DUF421 domain-containing protein [Aquibacillus halophilus]|uniref:DUF421 domain-containing protein n=2 Tax=Aquibacillus halophilus TaxID=930132 RepID=A0A6A8DBK5_9BACI|nr:DUF421 domain-containing protein [Aquibacillus halophilus]
MGKREVGELSILDVVVFLMLAEMAVTSIEDPDTNLFKTLVPMTVLLIIQKVIARISLKSSRFRHWFEGKPSVIISRGKLDEHEMKKQGYNFDDLMQQLRGNGTKSVQDVEFAILETSGKLSVFEKSSEENPISPDGYVLPLIVDGTVQKKALEKINKNEKWLKEQLENKGYNSMEAISFCTLDGKDKWFIDMKNEKS